MIIPNIKNKFKKFFLKLKEKNPKEFIEDESGSMKDKTIIALTASLIAMNVANAGWFSDNDTYCEQRIYDPTRPVHYSYDPNSILFGPDGLASTYSSSNVFSNIGVYSQMDTNSCMGENYNTIHYNNLVLSENELTGNANLIHKNNIELVRTTFAYEDKGQLFQHNGCRENWAKTASGAKHCPK